MAVTNGQLANQTTFNTAFVSRTIDTSTIGRVDLSNALSESGSGIVNTQRELNSLASFTGKTVNITKDAIPAWVNNDVGASGDSLWDRAEALTAEFDLTTGHNHDGTDGQGGVISAADLSETNFYFAEYGYAEITGASGTSTIVTTTFSGKDPNGDSLSEGVLTNAPSNKTQIISLSTGTFVEDAGGQKVYGRVTEASGVWTLTYYTNEAGTETSHNLSTQNIAIFYREVFNQQTRPTIPADIGDIGSLDLTADVVDASVSQRGVVTTGTQSFAGNKTFVDDVAIEEDLFFKEVNNAQSGSSVALTAPSATIVRLTNASLVSISGITAPSFNQVITLFNATGVTVSILNNADGTPARSILTNTGLDFILQNNAAIILFYDLTTAKWRMVGPDVPDASITVRGLVNVTTQSFSGAKTWEGGQRWRENVYLQEINNSASGVSTTLSNPSAGVIRLTSASLSSIDGITAPSFNQVVALFNATTNDIVIENDNANTAANGILTGTGDDFTFTEDAAILVIYDVTTARWRMLNGAGSSSASGTTPLTNTHIFVGNASNIATDVAMSGEASIINTGAVTLGTTAVTGKLLTGYTSGAGTVSATDSILSAIQKLNGNNLSSGYQLENCTFTVSLGSNAMTIAVKDAAGNDPSATSPVLIGFRSATSATGTYTQRSITSALSVVVSSGSTLGTISGVESFINIGFLDNAGTVELVVSNCGATSLDGRISTTAEGGAGAADSAFIFYSTTARSNVAYRLAGAVRSTQTTAGTWATAITSIFLNGNGLRYGSMTTDTVSYTPTISPISGFTNSPNGFWKRAGDTLEVYFDFRKNGSTGTGSGDLTGTIPSGLTMDTARIPVGMFVVGFGETFGIVAGSQIDRHVALFVTSTTTLAWTKPLSAVNYVGTDVAANSFFGLRAFVPIVGWFANGWSVG